MEFSESQMSRYARHIILPEIGGQGQARLLDAKVLVVGAGGLGSPLLLYLAAAGIGTLGIIDDDTVDLTNLQRQIIHDTASLGQPKVESAARRIAAINPDVRFVTIPERLTAANVVRLIQDYDLVADGSDNFATRYLLADACFLQRKTLVSAALLRFDGQISTYKPWLPVKQACYRCLFPEPPPPGLIPGCAEAGILGALAGVMGSMQAVEIVKEVLGIGESLSGQLLMYDGLNAVVRKVAVPRDPNCALCGDHPTIHDLSAHLVPGSGAAAADLCVRG
ncbi:MAG: molybdopterin-synthase adenylyltransferase MoeB [Azospirillaceae bacterium]|nr:molybdopterin-synthase adenylyltransferase MoeB [Azospirillaceae bacterium]